MRKEKIIPKRTTLLQKLAYILRPFVLYMLVKTFVMLFLAIAIPSMPISGITEWVEVHNNQLSAGVNGIASIVAVYFVLKEFLIEVDISGEVDIDKSVFGQLVSYFKTGFFGFDEFSGKDKPIGTRRESKIRKMRVFLLCIGVGVIASYSLNLLIKFISDMIQKQSLLGSEKYDVVETIQYSVPVWLGLILYGLVSPMVEEMVFRGITYNRIKRFYGLPKAVIFSALLFGGFHGNLPQFVYGSIMGGIIAVCYEYVGCFAAPVLVHMSANIFTFLLSVLE